MRIMNTNQANTPLLLVDGNNLLYRAAFGFPTKIYNRKKEDITTVFAFFALLRIAFREIGYPISPIVCFDGVHALDQRRLILSSYKENRVNNRDNPYAGLPLVIESLFALGIPSIIEDYYEADDVIACLTRVNKEQRKVYIMSSDKDFYQLLEKDVIVLNTMRKVGDRLVLKEMIMERFGIEASQWSYFRALMGDPADFIKGVSGIGPKTAVKLLSLSEEELRFELENRYQTSWQTFMDHVSIISLDKVVDFNLELAEKQIENFEAPARVIEKLGLWG